MDTRGLRRCETDAVPGGPAARLDGEHGTLPYLPPNQLRGIRGRHAEGEGLFLLGNHVFGDGQGEFHGVCGASAAVCLLESVRGGRHARAFRGINREVDGDASVRQHGRIVRPYGDLACVSFGGIVVVRRGGRRGNNLDGIVVRPDLHVKSGRTIQQTNGVGQSGFVNCESESLDGFGNIIIGNEHKDGLHAFESPCNIKRQTRSYSIVAAIGQTAAAALAEHDVGIKRFENGSRDVDLHFVLCFAAAVRRLADGNRRPHETNHCRRRERSHARTAAGDAVGQGESDGVE